MTVAETRSGAEEIFSVQIEVAGLGAVTALAFDVIFARATARFRVAARLPTQTAGHIAAARAAPLRSEIVEILFASVTFVTSHAWLARAFAFAVTLQAP
jgi:hypothetical protein